MGFAGTYRFLGETAKLLATTSRSGMARCLAALSEESVLHQVRVQKLLAAPTEANAANPSYAEEVAALQELGVAVERGALGFDYFVAAGRVAHGTTTDLAHKAAARLKVEVMLTRILADHYRQQNLVAWNRVEVAPADRGFVPFNGQIFSAVGFSSLDPVIRWAGKKQIHCPVVFDVPSGRCEPADVRSFHQRIERATHRGESTIPCLGVIAARDFAPEAWKLARTYRLVTVNFRQLFGDAALTALQEAEMLLADSDPVHADPGHLAALLDDLKGNPVVVHIRSIAFEVLAALALRADGWEQVGLGIDVPFVLPDAGETTRDVDVHGVRGDEARLIECKAVHAEKEVTAEEVRKFFTETVPAYMKWHRKRGDGLTKCHAELWTTGRFSDDAVKAFAALKHGKHVSPALCTAADIRQALPQRLCSRCGDLLAEIARHHDGKAAGGTRQVSQA